MDRWDDEDISEEERSQLGPVETVHDYKTLLNTLNNFKNMIKSTQDLDEKTTYLEEAATTSSNLAELSSHDDDNNIQAVDYSTQAIDYYSQALESGKAANRKDQWIQELESNLKECFTTALPIAKKLEPRNAVGVIESWVNLIEESSLKYICYMTIAEVLYTPSVTALDGREYGSALGNLKEASLALNEAEDLVHQNDADKYNRMRQDVELQTIRAKSMQIILTNDELLDELIELGDNSKQDVVYELVDAYRQAIQMTEGKKLETTSMAYRSLQRIYEDIMHNEERAEEYHKLAESCGVDTNETDQTVMVSYAASDQTVMRKDDPSKDVISDGGESVPETEEPIDGGDHNDNNGHTGRHAKRKHVKRSKQLPVPVQHIEESSTMGTPVLIEAYTCPSEKPKRRACRKKAYIYTVIQEEDNASLDGHNRKNKSCCGM